MTPGTLILLVVGIAILVAFVLFAILKAAVPLAVETKDLAELVRRRMKNPASATLRVTAISEPSFDGTDSTAQLTGVLFGDGIEPRAVQRKGMLAIARWPAIGQELPVIADRANPKLFFIDQSDMNASADAAPDEAEWLAAAMKSGAA